MAGLDNSIFRQRAIDKYMRRQEQYVILRLVSPRMFAFLWIMLLLVVSVGALIWSIQLPVLAQGKGIVVQQKAANGQAGQIVVLLLLSPDQQANLKAGEPVSVSITSSNITFNTSISAVEDGVMSPAEISTQVNLQTSLSPTIAGPSIVALAPVVPASQAKTYLGSQCQVQVQIGSQSALSLVPGITTLPDTLAAYYRNVIHLLNGLLMNF